MAEHIKTKRDEVSGTSKLGIVGRNQKGDGGSSQRNEYSFHHWLLDKPSRRKLHDNEYALDNMRLRSEDAHLGRSVPLKTILLRRYQRSSWILRLEFGLYPKSSDGTIVQCPKVVRLAKLMYFGLKPQQDKLVLTNDCGSDVLVRAEKNELWDWNCCACHCLNIAVQAAFKEPMIQGCLAPLTALTCRFSYSRSGWNRFKKM